MKKLLLTSTALAALVAFQTTAKADVTVGFSGGMGIGVGGIDYKDNTTANVLGAKLTDVNMQAVGTDVELTVKAEKDIAIGKAGVKVEYEANADGANDYQATINSSYPTTGNGEIDESSVYLTGNWGRVEVGNFDGAEDDRIHGYTDNVGGQTDYSFGQVGTGSSTIWPNAAFASGGNAAMALNTTTDIFDGGNSTGSDSGDVAKIMYTTPDFSGVKLSVSYAPNVSNSTTSVRVDQQYGFSLGYDKKMGDVGLSARANYSDANVTGYATTNAFGAAQAYFEGTAKLYGAGASVDYKGFKLLGGYYVSKDSDSATTEDENRNLSLGATYTFTPFKIIVSWTQNKWDDGVKSTSLAVSDFSATTTEWSAAVLMGLAPGVAIAAGGYTGTYDHSDNTKDADFNAAIAGVLVNF